MKMELIRKRFEELYEEAQYLWGRDGYYAAMLRISQIFNCLSYLDEPLRMMWLERIDQFELTDEIIASIKDKTKQALERINRIISIGDVFLSEEILLVLTLKVEVDLLYDFFKAQYDMAIVSERIIIETNDGLEALRKKNKKLFNRVISQMRKNWGLPINNYWLVYL